MKKRFFVVSFSAKKNGEEISRLIKFGSFGFPFKGEIMEEIDDRIGAVSDVYIIYLSEIAKDDYSKLKL